MDTGHWIFPYDFDVEDWFGFVYKITELDSGKMYIGKKQFTNLQRKRVKGRQNRKHIRKESDWKEYTSSSRILNENIEKKGKDNYLFEIVSLHKSKGSLHYAEVELQVKEDVLRAVMEDGSKKYYNGQISAVKFIPPTELLEEKKMRAKL